MTVKGSMPTKGKRFLSSAARPASYSVGTRSFPGVKWTGPDADHSPPSSGKVNNEWSYTSTSPYAFSTLALPLLNKLQSDVSKDFFFF